MREASSPTPEAWTEKTKGEESRLKCELVSYRSLASFAETPTIWVVAVDCNLTRTDGFAAGCIRAAHRQRMNSCSEYLA